MRLALGSDLTHQILGGSTRPLLFEPEIDWATFSEPNITHAY
jgi:hypothetical protein